MPPHEVAPRTPASPEAKAGWWIGIETSGIYGSVALARVDQRGREVVAAWTLPRDARSARTLAPALRDLLAGAGIKPGETAAVAIAVGPGSFTGLRLGVTTAKVLAWAVGAGVVGVDTLDVLAEGAGRPTGPAEALWAILDAQRGEVFAARFVAAEGLWRRDGGTFRATASELDQRRAEGDRVVGPPATTWGGESLEPTAEGVLAVAQRRWLAGERDDLFALLPNYHRLSAAEEKMTARLG